jgi:hypothetical protein
MEDLEKAEQALAASDTRRSDRRTRLQVSEDKNRLDDNRSDKENKPEDSWRRSTAEDKKVVCLKIVLRKSAFPNNIPTSGLKYSSFGFLNVWSLKIYP